MIWRACRLEQIKLTFVVLIASCLGVLLVYWLLSIETNYFARHRKQFENFVDWCESLTGGDDRQYSVTLDGVRYPKRVPSFHDANINYDCVNSKSNTKIILVWSWNDFSYGFGTHQPFIMHRCPIVNCEITNEREKLSHSDIVLVKYDSSLTRRNLPILSNPNSLLTLYLAEPVADLTTLRQFNGVFNMIATFHLNSDFSPYYLTNSKFHWLPNQDFNISNLFRIKLGSAVFVASPSETPNKKFLNFLKSLNRFLSVKIITDYHMKKAYSNYKFLIIYDTAIKCRDYVTNIFLDTFLHDTIPIVFNRRLAYDYFVPKSAYIRAYEFNTVKQLGLYLKSLEANETAFIEFFAWKKHIRVNENTYGSLCDICIKAHLLAEKKSKTIVYDLESTLKC